MTLSHITYMFAFVRVRVVPIGTPTLGAFDGGVEKDERRRARKDIIACDKLDF